MVFNYAVVILSHFPEYARHFLSTLQHFHKELPPILVVCDRHSERFNGFAKELYVGFPDFIYARNANAGIRYFEGMDIVLCNDDMECVETDFLHRLVSEARKFPKAGILSPLIDGGVGNPLQKYPPIDQWKSISVDTIAIQGEETDSYPVCFPCVYLSRRMMDTIGLLDERFTGYGEDDVDYCIRARRAGYWTMITRSLLIKHGEGGRYLDRGRNWSLSFARIENVKSNRELLLKKYECETNSH